MFALSPRSWTQSVALVHPRKKNIQTEYIFNDLLITFLPNLAVQCAVNCLAVPMVIVVIELSEPIRRLREWRKGSINLLINNKIRIETVPLVYGFLLLSYQAVRRWLTLPRRQKKSHVFGTATTDVVWLSWKVDQFVEFVLLTNWFSGSR